MALKANVFDGPFFEFLDIINRLGLVGHVADCQAYNNHSVLKQQFEKEQEVAPSEATVIGVRYSLAVPDVFRHDRTSYSYGKSHCKNEQMLVLGKELAERFQATTLVMGYEATERFLKSFSGPLFYALRNEWALWERERHSEQLKKLKKKDRPQNNTLQYFNAYVDLVARQNCAELLKELLDVFEPVSLRDKLEKYWTGSLRDYYKLLSFIRHTTVHMAGEPRTKDLEKLSGWGKAEAQKLTETSVITSRDTILPSPAQTQRILSAVVGLCYALYRAASDRLKMTLAPIQ